MKEDHSVFSRPQRSAIVGISMAGALMLAPTAATAAPVPAQTVATDGCEVTGGTLQWGVKESFRAYISGSIANGEWETSDGAEYETPNFTWSDATGTIDPETGTGSVSFTGIVHFTGHDGVLDLTLANPTVEFEGDGAAALLLDAKSNDMEGEVAVDESQARVGEITVEEDIAPHGEALDFTDMPITLTEDGAAAFAGFYEAGTDLDPLNLSLEFDGCESAAAAPGPSEPVEPQILEAPAPQIPWLPIAIGGVALLVIGFTVGMLVGGRRPKPRAATPHVGTEPESPAPTEQPPTDQPPAAGAEEAPPEEGAGSDDQTRKLFGEDR